MPNALYKLHYSPLHSIKVKQAVLHDGHAKCPVQIALQPFTWHQSEASGPA